MRSPVRRALPIVLVLGVLLGIPSVAGADVALLLGEPYGRFGSFSPTGHAAVYLSRVCAETTTRLRHCDPGEAGVVISRYHHVAGLDWIAVPLIPYLYAVEDVKDVPLAADAAGVATLRDTYRRTHLRHLIPDLPGPRMPSGNWIQLVGAAYDRRIVAFTVKTTTEQDEELIRSLNERENVERFNLLFRNCADFSRELINLYFPNALRSNVIADLGFTTPKHIAKSLVRYVAPRGDLEFSAFVIPQIPGSRPDSGNARGVLESIVKTKKYLIPLAVVQPWLSTGLAAGYLSTGRFRPDRYVTATYSPAEIDQRARAATSGVWTIPN